MDRGRLFIYDQVEVKKRSKLPHWHAEQGLYFVTYRLADSLPARAEERIHNAIAAERKRLFNQGMSGEPLEEALARFAFARYQPLLDKGHGNCELKESSAAAVVCDCWENRDGADYDLVATCVMPNHIHAVARLKPKIDISDVVETWKSVTTRRINRALGRSGSLWQEDYFDVLIRDEMQLRNVVKYVLDNPAKAGLTNWSWTRFYGDAFERQIA